MTINRFLSFSFSSQGEFSAVPVLGVDAFDDEKYEADEYLSSELFSLFNSNGLLMNGRQN